MTTCYICLKQKQNLFCKSCLLKNFSVSHSLPSVVPNLLLLKLKIHLLQIKLKILKQSLSETKTRITIRKVKLKEKAKFTIEGTEKSTELTKILKETEIKQRELIINLSDIFIRKDQWINIEKETKNKIQNQTLIQYCLHFLLLCCDLLNLKLPFEIDFYKVDFVKFCFNVLFFCYFCIGNPTSDFFNFTWNLEGVVLRLKEGKESGVFVKRKFDLDFGLFLDEFNRRNNPGLVSVKQTSRKEVKENDDEQDWDIL